MRRMWFLRYLRETYCSFRRADDSLCGHSTTIFRYGVAVFYVVRLWFKCFGVNSFHPQFPSSGIWSMFAIIDRMVLFPFLQDSCRCHVFTLTNMLRMRSLFIGKDTCSKSLCRHKPGWSTTYVAQVSHAAHFAAILGSQLSYSLLAFVGL